MALSRIRHHEFGEFRRVGGKHGYEAFFPARLPDRIALQPETAAVMADAEAALGRLRGLAHSLPNPHLLVRPSLVREAVASTRIEGTRTSIAEVYDADASDVELTPDLEEVVNAIRATEFAIARLDTLPMSMRLIREAHEIVLDGVRGRTRLPGELRSSQNWIGGPGSTIETASYVPPPPEAMQHALDDWERFVNAEFDSMPVLAQCALAHYQFEAIHPFLDGNGRIGRLVIVLFLVQRGRLDRPVLSLSPYFEQRRDLYIGHLQAVQDRGEIDPWLRFFCEAIVVQAGEGVTRAGALVDLRERYRQAVPPQAHAQALVDLLFDRPVLSGRLVQERLSVSRPTALRLLDDFAKRGLLIEGVTGPRGQRRWRAEEVLRVITAPDRR